MEIEGGGFVSVRCHHIVHLYFEGMYWSAPNLFKSSALLRIKKML